MKHGNPNTARQRHLEVHREAVRRRRTNERSYWWELQNRPDDPCAICDDVGTTTIAGREIPCVCQDAK